MAPPRQRPPTTLDDSRSEASSSTRERLPTGSKGGRRPANTAAGAGATSSKDAKALQPHDAEQDHAGISWSSMPLSVLHDYRHVYNLPTPSAYSSRIASILLSQGVGLRSPTAIAARRAQAVARRNNKNTSTTKSIQPSSRADAPKDVTDYFRVDGNSNGTLESTGMTREQSNRGINGDGSGELDLHRISTIRGQGRVSKDHLALAVRKHFNNVALVEQDAIARFLYKVREEGKGREFRLKFQP